MGGEVDSEGFHVLATLLILIISIYNGGWQDFPECGN